MGITKERKKTILLPIQQADLELSKLRFAAEILQKGGLVVFPTETVYGLGANALDEKAAENIFLAKGRPADNPLIVHIADFADLGQVVADLPPIAQALAEKFWPGPLTLILKKKESIPDAVTAGLPSVAVRMPDHPIARTLIKLSGLPIAAPSANLSGKVSPTSAEHVIEDLWGRVDVIIDGGRTGVGLESTVVDLTVWPPQLLRPGGVSLEELRQVVPELELDRALLDKNKQEKDMVPRSPGLKYTHYSPRAKVVLVRRGEKQKEKILELLESYQKAGKKVGILCREEWKSYFSKADFLLELTKGSDLQQAAYNLFNHLRRFDQVKMDVIIVEGVAEEGIGLAVMNRLTKAAQEIV